MKLNVYDIYILDIIIYQKLLPVRDFFFIYLNLKIKLILFFIILIDLLPVFNCATEVHLSVNGLNTSH